MYKDSFFSRRNFAKGAAGAWFLPSGMSAPGAQPESPRPLRRRLTADAIRGEIRRRADAYAGQSGLIVDYYRIRRQLVYSLPVRSLSLPSVPVPSISAYPWATWMMWALEERVHALAAATEWFKDDRYSRAAARDLEGLSEWPQYCQYKQPDLSSGHAGRLLWLAFTKYRWLPDSVRAKLRDACGRHLEEVLPLSDAYFKGLETSQDFLSLPAPHSKLPNIPIIGTIAAALTAQATQHPARSRLGQRLSAIMAALLELRAKGHTEGVAYDGYILDFLVHWLEVIPRDAADRILKHPAFPEYLEQSYMLSAPGAIEQVAELSDVEPKEMPFHYSAHAKLARFGLNPVLAWFLGGWPVEWIRADTLSVLAPLAGRLNGAMPPPGALDAHYATVLRSGWEEKDAAVAMSATPSPTGHIQADNGTVVIGSRGRWLISDPGYQQYMRGVEREFTIGPAAHNSPLINGVAQDSKKPGPVALDTVAPGLLRARVELAGCYPVAARAKSVVRTVWLHSNSTVVIADQVDAAGLESLTYHWHGHPEAAWGHQAGWLRLYFPDVDLWFTAPASPLSDSQVTRHAGSRGQLTATASIAPARPVTWWIFSISPAPPEYKLESSGKELQVQGVRFRV